MDDHDSGIRDVAVAAGTRDVDRLAEAVGRLERADPSYSARTGLWPAQTLTLAALAVIATAAVVLAPGATIAAAYGVMAVVFTLLLAVKAAAIAALLIPPPHPAAATAQSQAPAAETYPDYTVLVALHREAAVAGQLVAAMAALDYPAEALDIIFVLEAHDRETLEALRAEPLTPAMRVLTVPPGRPTTKPRALCYGLSFARGEHVVVYDAEDLPDPQQLKAAVAAFRTGGERLGCLQAALAIDNDGAGWLTAQFAVEYTSLFDAILPALARADLPILLGGTSNHFRRAALDDCGAWDPFNVTEDADLGLRLARRGWRVGVLASTTWEDAPDRWQPWLAQRTRWHKGWLQTYFVHMRDPARLLRELGPGAFVTVQVVLGGGLLAALAHPLFYALLALSALDPGGHLSPRLPDTLRLLSLANLAAAALATIVLSVLAVLRRRRASLLLAALAAPLYWLPVSCAAYVALWEWVQNPFYWAKTPHTRRTGAVAGVGAKTAPAPADQPRGTPSNTI